MFWESKHRAASVTIQPVILYATTTTLNHFGTENPKVGVAAPQHYAAVSELFTS